VKGYVDVGSGGLTFTASVDAPATTFALQLNFDTIDSVKRTTCGRYLQFKVISLLPAMTYVFDFGDAPDYQAFTRSVQEAVLLASCASRSEVGGSESEGDHAAQEPARKRSKSATKSDSGGGVVGGASDMSLELDLQLPETPAPAFLQTGQDEVNILLSKVYEVIEVLIQNFMRVDALHPHSVRIDMDSWSSRLSGLVKRLFALLLPRNVKQCAAYAASDNCRSLLLSLGHSPDPYTETTCSRSAGDTNMSGVRSTYVFTFDESTVNETVTSSVMAQAQALAHNSQADGHVPDG
jgi:hypothetical protein